jgi:hypothetical protein
LLPIDRLPRSRIQTPRGQLSRLNSSVVQPPLRERILLFNARYLPGFHIIQRVLTSKEWLFASIAIT